MGLLRSLRLVRAFNLLVWAFVLSLASGGGAAACGSKRYCKEMRNCADASYHLEVCGLDRLDRDKDGIPCESKCGKTRATYERRVKSQTGGGGIASFQRQVSPVTPALLNSGPQALSPPPSSAYACDGKKTCKEMNSCAEAMFYLKSCKVKSLDGNRDGIACNSLCR